MKGLLAERDHTDQVATRAVERQRMEDKLRARVEAAEKKAAAAGPPDLKRRRYNGRIG